jgi:hypothetical protein
MKKLTLTFCALFALFAAAPVIFADGPEPYSGKKEVMQPAPPVCDFYRAHEWDLDIWGAFAFAADTGEFAHTTDPRSNDPFFPDRDPSTVDLGTGFGNTALGAAAAFQAIDNPSENFAIQRISKNRLFARDDTWGGGLDAKYFWSRYFGAGLEAVGLAAKSKFVGGGLATLTARYPWGRFAPYAFGGIGFIDGGATLYEFFHEDNSQVIPGNAAVFFPNPPGTVPPGPNGQIFAQQNFVRPGTEREFVSIDAVKNTHLRGLGQLGLGLEYRVTCHIGLMADFSWNFVFGTEDKPDKVELVTQQGHDITTFFGAPVANITVINTAFVLKPGHGSDHQDFGMARFGVTFSY